MKTKLLKKIRKNIFLSYGPATNEYYIYNKFETIYPKYTISDKEAAIKQYYEYILYVFREKYGVKTKKLR